MNHKVLMSVLDAAAELRRRPDDVSPSGPYLKLCYGLNSAPQSERIDVAEVIYLHGEELLGSRAMDNCFEQNDGHEVARALAERADKNPRLHAAIARDFGGTFPQSWRS